MIKGNWTEIAKSAQQNGHVMQPFPGSSPDKDQAATCEQCGAGMFQFDHGTEQEITQADERLAEPCR